MLTLSRHPSTARKKRRQQFSAKKKKNRKIQQGSWACMHYYPVFQSNLHVITIVCTCVCVWCCFFFLNRTDNQLVKQLFGLCDVELGIINTRHLPPEIYVRLSWWMSTVFHERYTNTCFFFSPPVTLVAYLFCCEIQSRRKLVVLPFKWVISGRVLNFPDAHSSQSVMQVLTEVNIGLWSDDNKK